MQSDGGDSARRALRSMSRWVAETGDDAVEVAVVVAGMADEFEGSFGWHGVQDFVEALAVEVAGGGDPDGSVGGEDVFDCGSGVGVRTRS